MVECYYCRGDGGDPDFGRVLECPVCGGSGERDLLDDGDDEYPEDEDEDEPTQPQEPNHE